jgi:predicted restriction endonuclease
MAEYFDRKDDYGYVIWANEVKKRDHYVCDVCGRKGGGMNSHHLNSWADNPSQRYDISNGICLCKSDHDAFHRQFGKGRNTVAQYKEYKAIVESIIKIANKECLENTVARKMLQKAEEDIAIQAILKDLDGYHQLEESVVVEVEDPLV